MPGSAVQSSVPDQGDPPEVGIDNGLSPDGDDAGAAAAAEAEVETRARDMGWKPLAEYRGPPGKWQPAADFIARGENILPIVRDQNRRMTERMGKLEGEVTGLRSTVQEQLQIIKDLRDMGARADQRGYDRAMAEIKVNQRKAVEAGDTVAFDQLVEQAEALQSARPAAAAPVAAAPAPPVPGTPQPPTPSPATQAFFNENPWFNSDPFLNRKMIDAHIDVIQEGEITDEAAQFAEAKRRLTEAYPDRFGLAAPTPRPPVPPRSHARRAPSVAPPTPGGEPPPRPGQVATTIASIADPVERQQARDAFNRTKRQIPDFTEAEYMALYADPHGDVLSIQRPRK